MSSVGETWVCVASGPSLCLDDVDYVQGRARIAVTSDVWEQLPDADLMLASDNRWWKKHGLRVMRGFKGEKYTCSRVAANRHGIRLLGLGKASGWSEEPDTVASGGLTGYRLINLVGHRKPERIILIGYDMQHTGGRVHYFGNHPKDMPNFPDPEKHLKAFEELAEECPVPIINCTRETALECFPKAELREVL